MHMYFKSANFVAFYHESQSQSTDFSGGGIPQTCLHNGRAVIIGNILKFSIETVMSELNY